MPEGITNNPYNRLQLIQMLEDVQNLLIRNEDTIKAKTEECDKLKAELKFLGSQVDMWQSGHAEQACEVASQAKHIQALSTENSQLRGRLNDLNAGVTAVTGVSNYQKKIRELEAENRKLKQQAATAEREISAILSQRDELYEALTTTDRPNHADALARCRDYFEAWGTLPSQPEGEPKKPLGERVEELLSELADKPGTAEYAAEQEAIVTHLNERIEYLESANAALEQEASSKDEGIAKLLGKLQRKDGLIEAKYRRLNDYLGKIKELRRLVDQKSLQIDELTLSQDDLNVQLGKHHEARSDAQEVISHLEQSCEQKDAKLAELEADNRRLLKQVRTRNRAISLKDGRIAGLRGRLNELEADSVKLCDRVQVRDRSSSLKDSRIAGLQTKINELYEALAVSDWKPSHALALARCKEFVAIAKLRPNSSSGGWAAWVAALQADFKALAEKDAAREAIIEQLQKAATVRVVDHHGSTLAWVHCQGEVRVREANGVKVEVT